MVERTQRGAVLDGDRGKVRIGGEVAGVVGTEQQSRQQCVVAIGRVEHAGVGMVESVIDPAKRILQSKRVGENAGPGGQPDEAKQGDPTEADTARFDESGFQPCACWRVLRAVAVDGVQQHVDIRCFHWW